jgi:hypothetical protein
MLLPYRLQTVLKTLTTFHRLMRETDVSFMEEVGKVDGAGGGRGVAAHDQHILLPLQMRTPAELHTC